jgi:glycosyltransferase involved in cell wall biosynthesis
MKLTFVIPACDEQETIRPLVDAVRAHAGAHGLQFVLIDDGSTDATLAAMQALAETDSAIEVVRFAENRGKSAALQAGFERANGDVVFTMDADLQDDPAEIPRFLEALDSADLVVGWKQKRQDPWHKTLPSRVYNAALRALFGLALHDMNCGYKAMRAEVAKGLHLERGDHRLIPVMAHRLGYRIAEIPVQHHPRRHGHSKYGWKRFYTGARDALRHYRRPKK